MENKQHGKDWWPGGYIRRGKRGPTFMIDRRVSNVRFHLSTRCHTLTAAMKHLERFEADPDRYRPADGKVDLPLTSALVLEYRDHQVGKGLSREWVKDVARMLSHWADDLAGKDLLKLDLQRDVKPQLAKRGSKVARINALKGFFRWLRREKGLVKHHQDVTLDLAAPKGKAAKISKPKNVELARVKAIAAHLQPHVRDVLILQMGTGWHISEVRRFAARGRIFEPKEPGEVLAVLATEHKGGRVTRTPLRAIEHLDAARRVRARGQILSNHTLAFHTKRAAIAAGVEPMTLGTMRHSVSTWAIEGGARMGEVAEFFDHRSPNTTADHYANANVPTVSVPVHTLH